MYFGTVMKHSLTQTGASFVTRTIEFLGSILHQTKRWDLEGVPSRFASALRVPRQDNGEKELSICVWGDVEPGARELGIPTIPSAEILGVVASVASNVITIRGVEPGEVLVTASASAATVTVATTEHRAAVELSHVDLYSANGFKWVAVKVTTTANTNVAGALRRSNGRSG